MSIFLRPGVGEVAERPVVPGIRVMPVEERGAWFKTGAEGGKALEIGANLGNSGKARELVCGHYSAF